MSLLTIAQDVARDVGIDEPLSIINNEDDDAKRLLRMITATGIMLMREHPWQANRREASITTVASEDQGAISELVSDNDVDRILPDTVFNRSTQREQYGAQTPPEYAYSRARNTFDGYDQFMVRGGRLLIRPTPAAGNVLTFEYVSKKWIYDTGARKAAFTADSDETYLDEELLKLGTIARFKRSIGAQGWETDEADFRRQLHARKCDDTPAGTRSMVEAGAEPNLGFYVERTA